MVNKQEFNMSSITTRFEVLYRPWARDYAIVEWTNARVSPPEYRVLQSDSDRKIADEICCVLQEDYNREFAEYFG
jgi:hypothetical protein